MVTTANTFTGQTRDELLLWERLCESNDAHLPIRRIEHEDVVCRCHVSDDLWAMALNRGRAQDSLPKLDAVRLNAAQCEYSDVRACNSSTPAQTRPFSRPVA